MAHATALPTRGAHRPCVFLCFFLFCCFFLLFVFLFFVFLFLLVERFKSNKGGIPE